MYISQQIEALLLFPAAGPPNKTKQKTYLCGSIPPGAARVAGALVLVGGVDLGDLSALEDVVLGLVTHVRLPALGFVSEVLFRGFRFGVSFRGGGGRFGGNKVVPSLAVVFR